MPDCAAACTQYLPAAPFDSDLLLTSIIPFSNSTARMAWEEYNTTAKNMQVRRER